MWSVVKVRSTVKRDSLTTFFRWLLNRILAALLVSLVIRVKICAWHWLLLTLKTTSIKFQRHFDQITSAFIGFFKKPTEWRLSNGSQFCACYASKIITNDRCAWLCEGFVNIWDVNVFVSRVAVSLRIPGLKKKSLVKIMSPIHICRMVEVYGMDKLVRVLRNFGFVVSNPNRPFMFF